MTADETGSALTVEGPIKAAAALDWTVHPFRDRRTLGYAVLGMILVASLLAVLWTKNLFWGFFSFAVLFLSLESFYFPTRFILEEGKLTVIRRFSKSERDWSLFRRCYLDPDGITLSPFRRASWLETYRAIRLRFGAENREHVVRFVREHVGSGVDWVSDRRWKRTEGAV